MFKWAFYLLIVYWKRIFGRAHNMSIMWEAIKLMAISEAERKSTIYGGVNDRW